MLQKLTLVGFILSCFLATGATAQVVAVVGKKKITYKEFKKKYDDVRKQAINPPPPTVFLEDLVRFEVGVQQAYKQKLQNDPIVKERFRQEVYKALIEKSIGSKVQKIKVTEADMKRYYKKNPELRTSHILVEFKPGANSKQKLAAKKRAEEIYQEVRKSKRPFDQLVKLYTDDTLSKSTGGDIGYQSRMTLVPTYYNAAIRMSVGSVKGLIQTRYGYHIIKLTGKRNYDQANKRQIRAAVFDQKRKRIFDAYFNSLKKKYKITINKNLVKNIK